MRTTWTLLLAVVACGEPAGGGQSGTLIPAYCEEVSREPVADPSSVPDGLDNSLDEAMAFVEGSWTGTLAGSPLTLHVARSGTAQIVRARWVEAQNTNPDDPLPGAPTDCRSTYAVSVTASVTAGTLLAESFDAEVDLQGLQRLSFLGEVPLDQVQGDASPPFDPSDWDHTELVFDFAAVPPDGTTELRLTWTGSKEGANGNAQGTLDPLATVSLSR